MALFLYLIVFYNPYVDISDAMYNTDVGSSSPPLSNIVEMEGTICIRKEHEKSVEEKAKKIHELVVELDNINKRCEVYRTNLLAVLKDMEDQKLKLSVKVQKA